MFLALSKVLDVLLSPLGWALLLLAGAIVARRRRTLPALLAGLAIAVLYVFSSPLVANAIAGALESRAPRTFREDAAYDVAIVLGGAMDPAASEASGDPELGDAADRVAKGFELLRSGSARHVLVSGGTLDPRPGAELEAELTVAKLRAWGIPPGRLVAEPRSRNTRENALECARIVRERGWKTVVLVTSAGHMPRALGCFRAVGLAVDALPVDRRAGPLRLTVESFMPRTRALDTSSHTIREIAGGIVYRLAGWSK